jgi:hypothetical protein
VQTKCWCSYIHTDELCNGSPMRCDATGLELTAIRHVMMHTARNWWYVYTVLSPVGTVTAHMHSHLMRLRGKYIVQ